MKEGTTGLYKEASDCLVWFVVWSVQPVLCVFVGRSFLPSMFRKSECESFCFGECNGQPVLPCAHTIDDDYETVLGFEVERD